MTWGILKNEMLIPTRVSFSEMSCEIFHFIMTCKYNRTFYLMLYVICKVLEIKGIRYGIAKRPCLYKAFAHSCSSNKNLVSQENDLWTREDAKWAQIYLYLHVVVHTHGVYQLPPMDPRSNCSHAYIKEHQKEHTFTIPFASKNISLACNRLFSPWKPTISKPLAWDYEHGDLILSTWFSISNTIGILWNWEWKHLNTFISHQWTSFYLHV
jgi:hypothetical protein